MNKRVLLFTFCAIISVGDILSQTVQWAVRPTSAQLEGYGNFLKVRKNGKCGLINHNNQEIVPARYDSITAFRDGYALVLNRNGKQFKIEGIVSENDNDMLPLSESVYATQFMWFSDGKMPVRGLDGWGYLGTDGNMAIPCQFQVAYPFSSGFASVMLDDKAYYIDRNMDYLSVEAGYGNLLFASTFSGEEAVVYSANGYNPKGYVINRRGRIVRNYKVKAAELKVNKYDHSVGDRTKQLNEQVQQLQQDTRYTVFQSNRLYGYKKNGKIVLPAQLEKAEPVRGSYANVRFKGQNGVLKMIDGSFSVQMENSQINVYGSESDKGILNLSVPKALEDASVQLRMLDESGNEMSIQANTFQGLTRTYSFSPIEIPKKSGIIPYKLELWSDNLKLLEKQCDINYVVKAAKVSEKPVAVKPRQDNVDDNMVIASMSLSAPRAKGKTANPRNDFYVTVTVSNKSTIRGTALVSLYVDGKPVGSKSVSVRGQGSADAIFAVSNIKKERYAKVKATLKHGKSSHEANIHFMPFS